MSATGSIGKRILIGILVVPAFFAFRHWNEGRKAESARNQMIEMCADDEDCIASVEKFAEGCYRETQSGGRRGSVDRDAFVACVNHRSGQQLFVTLPRE